MRILITNDDGINAPGLSVLHDIATAIAGRDGAVWTVAPAFEQSGVSHKISLSDPMMIAKLGKRRFAAEGSPADCVLAGLYHVMEHKPDLILSGVNRGNNAAENTLYSGTIGGAMEGALQGIPAIALSQYLGPKNVKLDNPFEAAAQHGASVVENILDANLTDGGDYRLFYNVNFPPCPAADVKGVRIVRQGYRRASRFSTEPYEAPNGRTYLWVKGGPQHAEEIPDTDARANLDGYISVTPMRADLTAHDKLNSLKDAFAK